MAYDFDTIVDRRNTGSLKWDIKPGEIPMWVADMDFKVAPEIIEALEKRVAHGIFGYGIIPDEWFDAYINWWERRHDFKILKEWLIFSTGVVPTISSLVRKLTTPNENVVIMTPVYNIFFNSIINNGARVLESPLLYKEGVYSIDFENLEEKLSDPQTTLMILCNPHNPVGKIFTKDELAKIGDLAKKYNVTVISDEIHCDIVRPGLHYIPFASVNETCREISITAIAPTKCFNMAGLCTSAVVVSNEFLKHKVWRALNTDEIAEPGSFSVVAAVAAFNKGEAWLKEFNEYVFENRKLVEEFVEEIPGVEAVKGDATYLVWLDCSEVNFNGDLAEFIREKTGLYMTSGIEYGESGRNFIRMNVACPREMVKKGLALFKEGVLSAYSK